MTKVWSDIDWSQVGQEAVRDLQQLLQIDTTNPPGRELAAAEFLADRLREDELEPEILLVEKERANLVVRLEGSENLAPLLISGHTDVVPAMGDWTYPPFGGVISDGFLWGRGAIDMKNMVIMCLWAMKLLSRVKKSLRRTVIFAAVADEEAGSRKGSHWLVDNHPDKIRAGSMLTEVGGFSLHMMGRRFYPIQVAEKGQATVEMKATGDAGHGSMPMTDNAIGRLAHAVSKLVRHNLPRHMTSTQEAFLRQLAENMPLGVKQVFSLLRTPLADQFLRLLPESQARPLRACLHNTASPTILKAGVKDNSIPSEATATLDCRTLPGQTIQDLLRELHDLVGRDVTFHVLHEQPPISMENHHTDLYQLMCDTLLRYDPEGVPLPQMLPGFTDAKAYSRLGMKCYGFAPLKLPKDVAFTSLFHGVDERIPVDGFQWGLRVFADVVASYAGIHTK